MKKLTLGILGIGLIYSSIFSAEIISKRINGNDYEYTIKCNSGRLASIFKHINDPSPVWFWNGYKYNSLQEAVQAACR